MKKKILWFDTETTGTNPEKHDIIQIAMIIEIGDEIVDQQKYSVQPFNWDTIQPDALKVSGHTIDDLKGFMKPMELYPIIQKLLCKYVNKFDKQDKFYPAGYRVDFDLNFLNQFFIKCGDKYFGSFVNWKRLDPLPMMHLLDFCDEISLPNYKLETVCTHFNIPIQAHDALSDILATRELFYELMGGQIHG